MIPSGRRLGLGLGLHALSLLENPDDSAAFIRGIAGHVDYYELSGWRWWEQLRWLKGRRETLRRIRRLFPANARFIIHSTGLNVGSMTWHDSRASRFFGLLAEEFGAPWLLEDVGTWWRRQDKRLLPAREMLPAFYPALLEEPWIDAIADNIRRLERRLPVPFLPELAPFPFLAGRLGFLEALERLGRRADCGLLLDLGHLVSYAATAGIRGLRTQLERTDLSHVVELHVAGGHWHPRDPRLFIDSHCHALPREVRELLAFLLPRLPNVRAVTYEVFDLKGHEELSRRTLLEVGELCDKQGFARV